MTAGELTDIQRRILTALGTYRLLNADQMRRVGVGRSEATIRLETRVLERKGLVGGYPPMTRRRRERLVSGVTALPCLYWLLDRGAEILATGDPEHDPLGARREMGETSHIIHRMRTVETHIALRAWADATGQRLAWFVTDFEPGSGGRQRPTSIEYYGRHGSLFTPDALANLVGPDGLPRLLVFEIERGRRDAKRLTEFKKKLPQLREVSAENVVEHRFGCYGGHCAKFVVIFATAELRDKALTTWPEPGAPEWASFFVKCDNELSDFNGGWWRPSGRSQRPLFPFGSAAQPQTATPLPAA